MEWNVEVLYRMMELSRQRVDTGKRTKISHETVVVFSLPCRVVLSGCRGVVVVIVSRSRH
jgi:hypothetical protein